MSKFAKYHDYPVRSLDYAESALLTAWSSLERYHEDLVIVGGLAIRYLTKPARDYLPGPVTMDVDFGITLGASGGQYGTITQDLSGLGFRREGNRFMRLFEGIPIFIDFLTESLATDFGTVMVDDVPVGVFPGVDRALANRRLIPVAGKDLYGATQRMQVPVSEIGPLLVLKLNAFAGRQQPKDAYDILLATLRYVDGPAAAISAFHEESGLGNRGFVRADDALRRFFMTGDQSGPLRCAEFVLGNPRTEDTYRERQRQIVEQMITTARALLGD